MIQRYIIRYGLAVSAALVAALPMSIAAWAGEHDAATVSMWLTFFAWEWLLMEPSLHAGETLQDARARVRSSVVRDPVFWIFAAGALFAALRWINSGLHLVYDPETARWAVSAPAIAWFPSAAGELGRTSFAVASALATVVAALRNGMGRSARSMFLLVASAVAGLGGIVAAVLACCGSETLVAAAGGGLWQASFPGAPWTVWLFCAVVSLSAAEERAWRKAGGAAAFIAIAGCAAGTVFFCPAPVAALWLAVAVFAMFFSFVYTGTNSSLAASLRSFVLFSTAVAAAVILFFSAAPEKTVSEKLAGIEPAATLPSGHERMREALVANALRVWKDRPWLGAGLGGYPLRAPFFAAGDDWNDLPAKPAFVPNAFVQAFAERGISGGLFLISALLALFASLIARLAAAWRRHASGAAEAPPFHLSFPVIGWGPVVLVPVLVFEGFNVSSPALSSGEWVALGSALAAATAALPAGKRAANGNLTSGEK